MNKIRVLIFASGRGSNAEALMRKAESCSRIQIVGVLTNNPKAQVIEKAKRLNHKCFVLDSKNHPNYTSDIIEIIHQEKVDWICLAGYMKLLPQELLEDFARTHNNSVQIVNIHPSLLPAYPGLNSIRRAYEEGVNYSGITLHFVDSGMDTGKVITQAKVKCAGRSLLDFEDEIHQLEHKIYSDFLEKLNSQQIPTFFYEGL